MAPEKVEEVTKPKVQMTDKLDPKHEITLSKLSILFNDLAAGIRIADTYGDVKKIVMETDTAMNELSADFDELEEVLKP